MSEYNVSACNPRKLDYGDTLYSLPLRLFLGIYLILTGFCQFFTRAGHDNLVYQLDALKIPGLPNISWGVGSVEFFSGLLLLVGSFTTTAAVLNSVSPRAHFLLAVS